MDRTGQESRQILTVLGPDCTRTGLSLDHTSLDWTEVQTGLGSILDWNLDCTRDWTGLEPELDLSRLD